MFLATVDKLAFGFCKRCYNLNIKVYFCGEFKKFFKMETKLKLLIVFIVFSLSFGGFLIWQNYQTQKLLQEHYVALLKVTPPDLATQALGAQVYAESQDLVASKIPDLNPFNTAQANTIDQSYKNPFK